MTSEKKWANSRSPEFETFKTFLGFQLHKAAARLYTLQFPQMASYQLTPQHYGILLALNEEDGINQLLLGSRLSIDKAAMARALDRLQALGHVTRNASTHDRREKLVHITECGRQSCEALKAINQKIEDEVQNGLSTAERQQLLQLLVKLNASAQGNEVGQTRE